MKDDSPKVSMGRGFNSDFGYIELSSEIIFIGIFSDYIELECVNSVYRVIKDKEGKIWISKTIDKSGTK